MDLDLRKLRYFVAVAEQLNFGRAAEQLHIAQPVLSRQIRALEQELKVKLFVRGNRGTELTAAGRALMEEARHLLPAADGARRRVLDANTGHRTFTVGFAPGLIVTGAVRQLSQRQPLRPRQIAQRLLRDLEKGNRRQPARQPIELPQRLGAVDAIMVAALDCLEEPDHLFADGLADRVLDALHALPPRRRCARYRRVARFRRPGARRHGRRRLRWAR